MRKCVLPLQTGRRHLSCTMDQINADPKGNWYQIVQKID